MYMHAVSRLTNFFSRFMVQGRQHIVFLASSFQIGMAKVLADGSRLLSLATGQTLLRADLRLLFCDDEMSPFCFSKTSRYSLTYSLVLRSTFIYSM